MKRVDQEVPNHYTAKRPQAARQAVSQSGSLSGKAFVSTVTPASHNARLGYGPRDGKHE